MSCPACRHPNRPGASFCEACGAALASACSRCGAALRAQARFCDGCGQAVEAPHAPGAAPPLPPALGGGRYEMRRFLGEGGRKRVYLAHDGRLDRDVAISLIKSEGLDSESAARIQREARAMGQLGDHPHLVTVYDVGEEGGRTFIISQYLGGGDVEGLLQKAERHRLPLDLALRIADHVCRALAHAHARGIVHRDLKPGNVWLTEDGTAKLGDFGLAVALDRPRLTMEGMMVGTVSYMAPEQALGRTPDARSDLYALGTMLYELVTGRPPFLGDDAVAIISQHLNTPPVAPSWHNPEVPRALEALILGLLAKAPEDRPESAVAVGQALAAIGASAPAGGERLPAEEANPLERLAGGVFVGRGREMDELRGGVEEALSGKGGLLLLVGEPGIGKTRTAEELATYARLRKAQVLWGRCYEGEGAPAYWPWVQLIRTYVHEREPKLLLSEMGPGAADIAQVVSEVRERLPGLPAPPPLEPDQARFRLFDGVTTFLRAAARAQPLVLVLDDLHWADKPSLLLLQFLARHLREASLLVIGTYRDVELGRQHPLAQTLGDLARERLGQRVLLRGLTEKDVARFIEMTAGLPPPDALVTAVYRETEGNPFFVNEVVRLLVTDGRLQRPEAARSWSVSIPQSVREVVGRRLDHLSRECNAVLTTASVIGREFGLDALERLTELTGDQLLETLEEALAARVINEVPRVVNRYAFAHALIRETLYEELTTTRRVRLHRRIGEVLETLHAANPAPHLAELAYHFLAAAQGGGDVGKAIDYARRAGERATALLAYEEAVSHHDRALQALDLQEPADDLLRCELTLALGEAQSRTGDRELARETFKEVARLARRVGAPVLLARAALAFGGPWARFGVVDQVLLGLLEEALAALGDEDSALRARVLGRLAVELYYSGAEERRSVLSDQAVDMARRLGDTAALAYTLSARHHCRMGGENCEDRLADAIEIVRLAEETGHRELALEGHAFRISDLVELGDMPRVEAAIAEYARLAEQLRQWFYRWHAKLFAAMHALLVGQLERGEQLAQEAWAIGEKSESEDAFVAFGVQLALLRGEQGRSREIEEAARIFAESYPAIPAHRCGLTLCLAELGREAEARVEFEALAAQDFADLPRDANWLVALVMLSLVSGALGDTRRAAHLYELLLPYEGRNVVVGIGYVCYGPVAGYLGLLAATMSRWEDAARHYQAALALGTRMGARPWVANAQQQYAHMLLARGGPGDRERALELLGRALDTARELKMKRLLELCLGDKLRVQGIDSGDLRTSIGLVASAVHAEAPDLRRHAAPDGTVTILFTDIEGSTAMTERLGDQQAQEILRAHNGIVRQQLAAHGGFEVKSLGDGFMVAFQSAARALRCAVALQRSLSGHAARFPAEPLRIRIGLHTGEAIREADDFLGRAVILAARIAAKARGGEILVSGLLRELVRGTGEFSFDDGRQLELKGLSGTHQVHAVAWAEAADAAPPADAPGRAADGR